MQIRTVHRRLVLGTAMVASAMAAWLLPGATVRAEETPHPDLAVDVGLSGEVGTGPGISIRFELSPAEPGDPGTLAPFRTLRLSGDIGSLDLRGIPTCRPSTRSTQSPGCSAPPIGKTSGVAIKNPPNSESGSSLKLVGTFRLYSGGQQGDASKLYLWASIPGVGAHADGRAFVVPITYTRQGPGRSELVARFPRTEEDLLNIVLLRMSINRTVRVGGHSIPLTDVRCPLGRTDEASAKVSFWGPRQPVEATASLACKK